MWAWPVGIVGNVLLFTVFIGTAVNGQTIPLLGQAGRQVFFVLVSVYGWKRWHETRRTRRRAHPPSTPRWATPAERLRTWPWPRRRCSCCSPSSTRSGPPGRRPTWYFLADAWIFVGSILATYAMARGWVDFWLCWIAVDLVGVPALLHFKLYPTALLYGVYGVLVVCGFLAWRGSPASEPLARTRRWSPSHERACARRVRLDPVERAIADIAAGEPVVVVDDEDRENEGDLRLRRVEGHPGS